MKYVDCHPEYQPCPSVYVCAWKRSLSYGIYNHIKHDETVRLNHNWEMFPRVSWDGSKPVVWRGWWIRTPYTLLLRHKRTQTKFAGFVQVFELRTHQYVTNERWVTVCQIRAGCKSCEALKKCDKWYLKDKVTRFRAWSSVITKSKLYESEG